MSRSILRALKSLSAVGPSAIRAIPRTTHFTLLRVQSRAPLFSTVQKWYSSQVDRHFTEVLSKEIKQEKENVYDSSPPKGFSVEKSDGTEILLRKEYSDGVCVEIEVDLAGSVNPEFDEAEDELSEKKEEAPTLEARPDIRIRLVKPTGRSVIFNCSFPSGATRQQASSENSNIPTYSVDSVEMERLPGYFVYTDLFDDNMYDHTMQLLMERNLDAKFQEELQDFCTSEEHKLAFNGDWVLTNSTVVNTRPSDQRGMSKDIRKRSDAPVRAHEGTDPVAQRPPGPIHSIQLHATSVPPVFQFSD